MGRPLPAARATCPTLGSRTASNRCRPTHVAPRWWTRRGSAVNFGSVRGVHPAAHPPRLLTPPARPAPEPRGAKPPPAVVCADDDSEGPGVISDSDFHLKARGYRFLYN